jgi:hypothetical protein
MVNSLIFATGVLTGYAVLIAFLRWVNRMQLRRKLNNLPPVKLDCHDAPHIRPDGWCACRCYRCRGSYGGCLCTECACRGHE